ncbi:unnamed protein product, partial [Allacma fusca]
MDSTILVLLTFGLLLPSPAFEWNFLNVIKQHHFPESSLENLDLIHLLSQKPRGIYNAVPEKYKNSPRTNLVVGNYSQPGVVMSVMKYHKKKTIILTEIEFSRESLESIDTKFLLTFTQPLNTVNVFILKSVPRIGEFEILKEIASKTRRALNSYFYLLRANQSRIFWRKYGTGSLIPVEGIGQNLLTHDTHPNFEATVLKAIICTVCVYLVEFLKKNSEMSSMDTVSLYELGLRLNATIEFEPVFGQPYKGMDENGDWDGYAQPVIDGETVFTTVVMPAVETFPLIQVTRPIYSDSIIFVYGLPKPIPFSAFLRLHRPFTIMVWIMSAVSAFAMFLVLQGILYFQEAYLGKEID